MLLVGRTGTIASKEQLVSRLGRPGTYEPASVDLPRRCIDPRSLAEGGVIRLPGASLSEKIAGHIGGMKVDGKTYSHGVICAFREAGHVITSKVVEAPSDLVDGIVSVRQFVGENRGRSIDNLRRVQEGFQELSEQREALDGLFARVIGAEDHHYEELAPVDGHPYGFVIDARTSRLVVPDKSALDNGTGYFSSGTALLSQNGAPELAQTAMTALEVATHYVLNKTQYDGQLPLLVLTGEPIGPRVSEL